jgi:GMP synthase-like glutamine amidotransferase
MKIGLLQCDHVAERFQHIAGDYPAMFAALFQPVDASLEWRLYDVCRGVWPAELDECEAYVCTGSRASVYDADPWIATLKAFVRQIVEAEKPFVGICFGHQMLAEAYGGQVGKAAAGWGVGLHTLTITRPEPWMNPAAEQCDLQYMHQDQVLRLPEQAVLLGSTAHCPNAFFRLGMTQLGIQAHPEFMADYAATLLHDRRERIGEQKVTAALARIQQPADAQRLAGWLSHFLNQAVQSRIG